MTDKTNESKISRIGDEYEQILESLMRKLSLSEERTETKNEKGEVTSWREEGEWRKASKDKDGRGRVTNLSDKARRETEKLKKEVAEAKPDFAAKFKKNIDKHNTAVIKTKKEIGTRVADIGPGGKEYNVKTDKEWDKQKGVTEGKNVGFTPEIISALKNQGYKGPYKLQALRKWYKLLNRHQMLDGNSDIMVQGNDIDYDGWVVPWGDEFLAGAEYQSGPTTANKLLKQGVAEMNVGKRKPKPDSYHINKDGKPVSLSSYDDKDSAIKDRDEKHPGAEVHQVGSRGKVKGKFEEGAKVDRMVKHVKSSEKKLGHDDKEAENIAWATANKRGMLDNKNKKVEEDKDPCWDNYKQIGMKKKNGKTVPNCVPKK